MKKMSETRLEKALFKAYEQEQEKVNTEVSKYYDDGSLAEFRYSSDRSLLAPFLSRTNTAQEQTDEKLIEYYRESCSKIRNNVKQGKPNSIEIRLNQGRQLSDKRVLPLGNTVLKLFLMGEDAPEYIFIKAGDTLDALIFIGGDNNQCFMVIRNENGNDYFLPLSEFHMLSLIDDPDSRKEIGLMTSFVWLTPKVYSSVVMGSSLNPIKNLLLSEWLQMEWKRAIEADPQSSIEVVEGDING